MQSTPVLNKRAPVQDTPKDKTDDLVVATNDGKNENLSPDTTNLPAKIIDGKKKPDIALVTKIEKEPDETLVSDAFKYLKDTFKQHFHEAMLEAGRYLIQKFYDNDYTHARSGKKVKKESLNQLIKKLQENSGDAPSKTWIYDAVKLAVDQHDYESFRTYGNLGHSQKLLLTHVRDNGKKKALIDEAAEKNYTVVDLRKRIREEKGKLSADRISLQENIPVDKLETLDLKKLEKIKIKAEKLEKNIKETLVIYQANLKTINQVLEIKVKKDPGGME